MKIGIMGAMTEEIAGLVDAMGSRREQVEVGRRTYHVGELYGREVVIVFSRWGKVAAATTATELLARHGVERMIFTGVAGAVSPALRVGDVVVGSTLYQHDMNGSPLFPRHEIPLLGVSGFETEASARREAALAVERFLARRREWIPDEVASEFGIAAPKVVEGAIASGDKFFADGAELGELRGRLPDVACVEMEGAAVAQVCHEYGVPLTVIRTISDAADEGAPVDFARFVREIASRYSLGVVRSLLGG
ncbi:5'-methylthioadenosine/adenosylhomocysteine nucleosidase [Vulgatibacter incomptus]|uniref:adenosylhomocysteine nucleosidase n=1 Tax=Vulgatibacter incomptus TaxID=1391653 RepID=A0A0K1PGG0_9BACT|nr:5'-methylthioadenosine/adenosylhomocysteine nucleosidase [Vulgatibacter incomptus]AKU92605.1 5'-methylthioadenosine nucleosidase [Vulgatibacter incomptus]